MTAHTYTVEVYETSGIIAGGGGGGWFSWVVWRGDDMAASGGAFTHDEAMQQATAARNELLHGAEEVAS